MSEAEKAIEKLSEIANEHKGWVKDLKWYFSESSPLSYFEEISKGCKDIKEELDKAYDKHRNVLDQAEADTEWIEGICSSCKDNMIDNLGEEDGYNQFREPYDENVNLEGKIKDNIKALCHIL